MAIEVLWIVVGGLSGMGAALILWIVRDEAAAARKPAFKWDGFRGKK